MDLREFKDIKDFLDAFIRTHHGVTNRTLAISTDFNESYISKLRSKSIDPSQDFMDRLCNYLVAHFPAEFFGKETAALKALTGFIDKPFREEIVAMLVTDKRPYFNIEERIKDNPRYSSDSDTADSEPKIRVSVVYPNSIDSIEARVLTMPFVHAEYKELRASFALETEKFSGSRAELSFRQVQSKFYADVEGGYIRFKSSVRTDTHTRIPLGWVELEIFPERELFEDFFERRYKSPEEAWFAADEMDVFSLPPDKIRNLIDKSSIFDPRVQGKALFDENPLLYHQVRFPRLSRQGGIQTALIGTVGTDTLNRMTIQVSPSKKQSCTEEYEGVFELAKEDLERNGVYGIDNFYHEIKNEYDSSGESDSLAAYILIVSAQTGITIPEGTVAIGALDGSSINISSRSLGRKLELLSDCRYLIIGVSGYAQAERFFSKLPAEQRPEIITLRQREDILTCPLFKDRLFPTEQDFAPSAQQIAESGFKLENFAPMCGLIMPTVLMHSNVGEGYKADQIIIEFTDKYTGWVKELRPLVEDSVKEFKLQGEERSPDFYYFNGDLANVNAVHLESFDDTDTQAFRHHLSKAECDWYITQMMTLDKPLLQDGEGHTCTVRSKYAHVGRNLEQSPLVVQLTATCHVMFMKRGEPYEILIGVRADNLAGYGNTFSSPMACCISVNDSPDNMLNDPGRYKYPDRDSAKEMLDRQQTKIPHDRPHPAISMLREMSDESGIRIEIDHIIFLGLTLNLRDYDLAWGAYVQIDATDRSPLDMVQSFRAEHTEFKEMRLVRFDLEAILDLIEEERGWHPPALASLLMVLSRHFGEETVKDEIWRRRIRKLWLAPPV